jgi:hypothetical protein
MATSNCTAAAPPAASRTRRRLNERRVVRKGGTRAGPRVIDLGAARPCGRTEAP